jgi:endonuclease-3
MNKKENKKYIHSIFKILSKEYAGADFTELNHHDPFTLLVAVMLSAQATDKMVNKITEKLFKIARTPEEFVRLGEDGLKIHIKSINYFNTKAKNIISASRQLIERFDSKAPDNMEDLTSLAGVGRKTASIILNVIYNKKAIAVDTHVFRLSHRLGLANCKNVLETEKQLLNIIPDEYAKYINSYFVLLGRYICKAKNPRCEECPLGKICRRNFIAF